MLCPARLAYTRAEKTRFHIVCKHKHKSACHDHNFSMTCCAACLYTQMPAESILLFVVLRFRRYASRRVRQRITGALRAGMQLNRKQCILAIILYVRCACISCCATCASYMRGLSPHFMTHQNSCALRSINPQSRKNRKNKNKT